MITVQFICIQNSYKVKWISFPDYSDTRYKGRINAMAQRTEGFDLWR